MACGSDFEPDLSGWHASTVPGRARVHLDINGREIILQLPGDERVTYRYPQWTKSSPEILLVQVIKTADCGNFQLLAIDTTGRITDTVYTPPPSTALNFKLAPNDSLLLLKTYKDNCETREEFRYTFYNRFTKEALPDTISVRNSRGILLYETVWSPDSKKVIIPEWSTRVLQKAFVYDLVTKDTTFISRGVNFIWSPSDNDLVGYINDMSIYTKNIRTGEEQQVFEGKKKRGAAQFRWSPGGDFLMIHLRRYLLNIEAPMTQSNTVLYYSVKDRMESDIHYTEPQFDTWMKVD
jgi:hypothetical protein